MAFDKLMQMLMAAGAAVAGPGGMAQVLETANRQACERFHNLRFGDLQTAAHDPIRAGVATVL